MVEKKTVLLVDDDRDFAEQMNAAIQQEYRTAVAYDGDEALETIAVTKPDCIVMDVMMNHMAEGLDLSKNRKDDAATRDIPVIMVTSVNKHYDYRTRISEDCFPRDVWLDKPVAPRVLLQEIKKLIG